MSQSEERVLWAESQHQTTLTSKDDVPVPLLDNKPFADNVSWAIYSVVRGGQPSSVILSLTIPGLKLGPTKKTFEFGVTRKLYDKFYTTTPRKEKALVIGFMRDGILYQLKLDLAASSEFGRMDAALGYLTTEGYLPPKKEVRHYDLRALVNVDAHVPSASATGLQRSPFASGHGHTGG